MRRPAAVLCLVAISCSQDPQQVTPPTFERPSRVAFFCFDSGSDRLLALSECVNRQSDDDVGLNALVTQTARGEIATVDLRSNTVIDTDIRVPGFTFVRVGEVPTAIVIPAENPTMTYIASFGSRWVQWVPTGRFRPELGDTSTAEDFVPLPDGPADMLLSPNEETLFVALPELGQLVPIEIGGTGALVPPTDADLVELTLPSMVTMPSTMAPPSDYRHICIDDTQSSEGFRQPVAIEPVMGPDVDLTAAPRPVDLELLQGSGGDELLVADENLPVVHRLSIGDDGTLTPLDPIVTGVPVIAIAATPPVPTVVGDPDSPEERYLYAIDGTDGTVMVIDITDPDSDTFGAPVPVSVGDERPDRLDLFGKATSLAVMTPGFGGPECTPDSLSDELLPASLSGVFVAIGLGSGVVQVVDVYDLNAECRGAGDCSMDTFANERDRDGEVYLWRHRPRLGTFVTTGISIQGNAAFAFEQTPGVLDDSGRPRSGEGPGLAPLFTENGDNVETMCPAFMGGIFPVNESERAVICAVRDPWAAREERWTATWRGAIPRSGGGFGRVEEVDGETRLIARDARFCERGVLGAQNVADQVADGSLLVEPDEDMGRPADPEAAYTGDRLVITTNPPMDRDGEIPEACDPFVENDEGVREEQLSFPILRSHQGFVVVDDSEALNTLATCWNGALFGYEVRTGNAFSVVGSVSGFVHRVIIGAEDRCEVDTVGQPIVADDPDTYRNARAFDDVLYTNPYVAFQIDIAPGDDPPTVLADTTAQFSFTIANVPNLLGSDIGNRGRSNRRPAIVESLVYSPQDERLYAVDSNSDGLARISTEPFARERTFE